MWLGHTAKASEPLGCKPPVPSPEAMPSQGSILTGRVLVPPRGAPCLCVWGGGGDTFPREPRPLLLTKGAGSAPIGEGDIDIFIDRKVKCNTQSIFICSFTQTSLHKFLPPGSPLGFTLADAIFLSSKHSLPAMNPAFMSFSTFPPGVMTICVSELMHGTDTRGFSQGPVPHST